jgi:energy-coupling factor transport system substrate-specific component
MSKLISIEKVAMPKLKPAYIAALLPTGVAINYAGSLIRQLLGVPLFLDAGGTIFVSFIAGPWFGFLCAVLNSCVTALTMGPIQILGFVPTGIIAIIVGYAAKNGITRTWFGLILTLLVIQPPACLASAYIYTYIFGGFMGNALDIMHAVVMQATKNVFAGSFLSELLTGLLDKTVLTIVLMLIFRALPEKLRICTPFKKKSEAVEDEETAEKTKIVQ